jgi:hypothetical protein
MAKMPANKITRHLPALNFMNAPEQWKMTTFSLDAGGGGCWQGKSGPESGVTTGHQGLKPALVRF